MKNGRGMYIEQEDEQDIERGSTIMMTRKFK